MLLRHPSLLTASRAGLSPEQRLCRTRLAISSIASLSTGSNMARPTRSSLRDLLPTLQQVGSRRFSALSGTRLYANSLSQPLIRPSLAPSTNSFGGNPSRPWDPTEIYIPTTRRIRRFSSYRGFPNTGPETAFWILLGLNVIPFLAWNAISFSNAPWANKMRWFMEDHFLFKESAGKAKPWTILTSGFSHVSIAHFGFNMFSLYTCTKILGITTSLGTASVLGLQIAGILGGNLASVYMQRNAVAAAKAKGDTRAARQIAMRSSLGASGGVSACLVAGACYAPMFKVHAMFIPIPIPLAVFAGLYMLFDTYNVGNTMSKTGHEAHVGGGITGALFWLLFKGR